MALLFPPGIRVCDPDNNPINGGKIRVYVAGTTTLANLYSDSGLTSAILNPVVADSSGYPANGGNECAINVAGGTYDVAFLRDNDDPTGMPSWDDVVPWGSEAGDIERTLTSNARLKITGSAGAVLIQAGSPSPDDVGGDLTIEGQAGTQLDTLTLDAAATNFTGGITEKGKTFPSVIQTAATTFTAVSNLDIALPNDPAGTRAWEVEVFDFFQSLTGNIRARFSYDGAGSYKSGASDYDLGRVNSGTNGWTTGGGAEAFMDLTINSQTPSNKPGLIKLQIVTPDSGAHSTSLQGIITAYENTGTPKAERYSSVHYGLGGYGRATHVRLYNSGGGTLTGKYLVRALRGYGEAAA